MGAENSTEEGRHAIRVENVNIIAKYINNSTNIVVLTGAGISTSAGESLPTCILLISPPC